MLYFIYGQDTLGARKKSSELISSLQKKKPNASFFKIDKDNFREGLLDEYIESKGLFEEKYIILLDNLCSDKNSKDSVMKNLEEISSSQNIFIILDGKIDKATSSKIEKKSAKAQNFELKEKNTKESYTNTFALADAFARKDRKGAWTLYRKAIDKGEAPEALHGMLFWKIKSMILSSSFGVYGKDELLFSLEKLLDIYHDARRGNGELETCVERFLLSL